MSLRLDVNVLSLTSTFSGSRDCFESLPSPFSRSSSSWSLSCSWTVPTFLLAGWTLHVVSTRAIQSYDECQATRERRCPFLSILGVLLRRNSCSIPICKSSQFFLENVCRVSLMSFAKSHNCRLPPGLGILERYFQRMPFSVFSTHRSHCLEFPSRSAFQPKRTLRC